MKRVFAVLVTILVCSGSVNVSAQDVQRYPIKSAIVEYEVSGSQTGTETLYFDDFGSREARYSDLEVDVFGFKTVTKNATIVDGDWVYTVDLDESTGTKMNIAKAKDMAIKGMRNQAIMEYGKKMLDQMGAVNEGTETVLGKECQVYSLPRMNTRVWIYKRMALKSTARVAGMTVDVVATSVKENVPIPADKLSVPENITVTDVSKELEAARDAFMNSFGG